MIETFADGDTVLAVIIRRSYRSEGIQFFTPDTFSQQLGYMNRPAQYVIAPHAHNPVPRVVEWTQEVLFIKSGRVRLDLYTSERQYLKSSILDAGDVVLLAHGGHGFKILDDAEIIEVKQGPYAGEHDKVRFAHVEDDQVRFT